MATNRLMCGLLTTVPQDGPLLLDSQDWALLQDVYLDLAFKKELYYARLKAAVNRGKVILWGQVDNDLQREIASAVVARIPGVEQVENNITVAENKEVTSLFDAQLACAQPY